MVKTKLHEEDQVEQVVMQAVHNAYYCEQCEWCNTWYVPGKGHTCQKNQIEEVKEEANTAQ